MTHKEKAFDCVEMKNRIQADLKKEYETRKAEFKSYVDFLNSTANESDEIRTFLEKVTKTKTATKN